MHRLTMFVFKKIHFVYKKLISPFFGTRCRFYPTCSDYALEALERKGLFKGSALALIRILKCNPFHPGGFDSLDDKIRSKK